MQNRREGARGAQGRKSSRLRRYRAERLHDPSHRFSCADTDEICGNADRKRRKYDWKSLVSEADLQVISIHEDLGTVKNSPEKVIEEAKNFGTDKVVITGMYRFDYGSAEALEGLCRDLSQCGKILADSGIQLLYHNHNCELLKLSAPEKEAPFCSALRGSAYDYIFRHTDPDTVGFEFDSYWFTDGGANVPAVMQALGPRMKLWHVTDRGTRQSGPSMTPILKYDSMEAGYGSMDLDTLCAIAKENGIDAAVLETHRNFKDNSPLTSLKLSAEYLNRRFHSRSVPERSVRM